MNATATPTELSQEQIEDYRELRSLLRPSETVRVPDDFAKWPFASAALISSLGAAFGASGLSELSETGRRVFLVAVLCVALSLVLAAFARSPRRLVVNRYMPDDLRRALDSAIKTRYCLLRVASFSFGAALALAGFAPLL